jgi:hypothetical protein
MKSLVALLIFALTISSCKNTKYVDCDAYKTHYKPVKAEKHKHAKCDAYSSIIIVPSDTTDGRPTFTVYFSDGKALDYMYPEEIAQSLNTGKWDYDETLMLTHQN